MSRLALDHTFAGRRVPPWLRRFEAAPEEALRDLLLGGADLGHLNPADPEQVLLDWIASLGPRSGLMAEVDRALAAWIKRSWGDPDLQGLGAAVTAVAWCRAADLITGCPGEEGLAGASRGLRERFLEEPSFLRSIAEGRARDPEARSWLALAEHQADRLLLPRWWALCSLPPDIPWYHGELGVYGLRRLPPEAPQTAGGFPKEVPEGLARLADALARRVEDGWLDSEPARAEFTATARLTMEAYPFPREKWLPFWRHVLQDRRLRESLAERWVRDLSPKLDKLPEKGPAARRRWVQPDPEWARRAHEIAVKLERGETTELVPARSLLEEQRSYAQATGETHFVVRSACHFAGKLRKSNPRQALEWVRLALEFAPWDHFAWTTTAAVNLTLGHLTEAAKAAREAVRRFPNDPVAHRTLGEVLKAQGRFDDAEAVLRYAIERFPAEPESLTSLATLLTRRGELDEAEKLLTRAIELEPRNTNRRTTLKRLRALREGGEISFESAPESEPIQSEDLSVLLTDALFLRRWSRALRQEPGERIGEIRKKAQAALESLLRLESRSSMAAGEAGLLTLAEGDLEAGLTLLREAAKRFPGSARVRYALARAERQAVSAHALDPRDPEAPIRPWRRLARIEPQLGAVALLGEARTWLGQTDGAVREAHARQKLGELAFWIHIQLAREEERRKDSYAELSAWWAREAQRLVFGRRADRREEDLGELSFYQEMIETHAAELDLHEEDAVYRVAGA